MLRDKGTFHQGEALVTREDTWACEASGASAGLDTAVALGRVLHVAWGVEGSHLTQHCTGAAGSSLRPLARVLTSATFLMSLLVSKDLA